MALDNNTQITDRNTINNWFKTGLKPNQQQFWSTWASFWHKSDTLPIGSIKGLGDLIDGKAEENHTHDIYATNDATSLNSENVTAWKKKLGVADLKFDDKAITITQDYADFGLQSGATINAFNNAIYTEVARKLDAPTENATNDYVLLADGSTAPKSDFGKVDKVMGVSPDANKNVDISGVAMNWTNANQRFSGLVDKSADATYNALLGMDNQGKAGKLTALGNVLESGLQTISSAQALRIGQLLNGGVGSSGTMSVNTISPLIIQNKYNTNEYVVLQGANLYLNNTNYAVEILDSTKTTVLATIPQSQIQLYASGTQLIFYYNFYQFAEGTYFLRLNSGSKIYITTLGLSIVQEVANIDINNITWDYVKSDDITKPAINQAQGGHLSLLSAGVLSTAFNQSYKSSEIFAEGEDFFIELSITPYSGGVWRDTFHKIYFGIGYSSTPNTLQKNVMVHYGRSFDSHFLNDVSSELGPVGVSQSVYIKKVGNLFTISSGHFIRTVILSNNSGYSFFAQTQGIDSYIEMQVQILRAFKLN